MGVATGDYNNDGFEDLYVTCLGPDHLFIDLRQIAGDDSHPRADAATITLHANGLDENRIIRVPVVVAQ